METEELRRELTNLLTATCDDLMNLLRCMEEYFKAGGSEGFIKKVSIVDQTEDETPDEDADAFVLRDVLNYMEEYCKALGFEESANKLTIIDQGEDEPLIFVDHNTYFVVVSYALQFSSDLENLAIMGLFFIAESYNIIKQLLPRHPRHVERIMKSRREFSDMLMNTFIPLVRRFFEIQKIEELPDNDEKHLKKNEILASFIDFLLQMLFCEVNSDSAGAEQFSLLQKELSFLLAILGDIPFQHSMHPELDEQLNNILAGFEMLANKVGGFLFSCFFPFQPMKVGRFHTETNALLEMAKLLNAMIKEYCTNFSKLHVSVIVKSKVVDSFFIINSLVEDLEGIIMDGQLGSFPLVDPINEQIRTLYGWLTLCQGFIKALQDNKTIKEKGGLFQIRDLTYEAEYLINSFVVGNIHVWYLNLRLQSIIQKIKLVCNGFQQVSGDKVIKAYDGKVSLTTTENTAAIDDAQFLDCNHDITQRFLNDLIGKSNTSQQVISIFGMPGLGKTTTASKLYSCHSSYFDRRAWCVVSQNYNLRNLMIKILMCLISTTDASNISKNEVAELGVQIHQTLFGRRYLIVLDDVWNSDVWDKLQIYFPDDRNGSRVIITTRNENVSPSGSINYKLPLLSEYQCWNLLEKKVFHKDPCPSHLVDIGKRIAARCSGVPLAVVSIAGVLVNLEKEESEWDRVEEGLENILLDDQSDYRKIMELSYQHLPHYIKPCFLYFARFPEDAEISTKELSWHWISQGFIQKDGNKSPEEIAEMYLSNLMNRSLVMTATRRSIGGAKTCRVHDLLHDICIKKAEEENFFNSTNLLSTYNKHQHLCVPISSNANWRPFGLHCRSYKGHSKQSSGFRTMALLKVVDLLQKNRFEPQRFEPLRFDLPWQLRYLGIITKLIPEEMVGNLVKLEILHVRADYEKAIVIPSVILRVAKLRHMSVRYAAKFEDAGNIISETTNLRSISHIVIEKKSDEEILRKSPHLLILKCLCRGEIMFPDLSGLAELESLGMIFKNRISHLELKFPPTIKKLCLQDSKLPWEKMSLIGELPNLEVLKLKQYAFEGKEWETEDDQFKELRFLKIEYLDLTQWISESCHFPSLEQLVLICCWKLQDIPSDFDCIPTLQRIEMRGCLKEACISAIEIEQEQLQYDNQIQLDIIDDRWTKEELMREYTESTREETE